MYKIVRGRQSSFFWIMQLLPKAKKVGAYTIFAFNHHLEKEIVKSDLSKEEKLEMLNAWRDEIDNIFDKKVPETEIGRKIYKNCMRFHIPKQTFVKAIEAYIKSIKANNFNPTLDEYIQYCHDVYGSRIEMALMISDTKNPEFANIMAEFIHPVVALENMKEDCMMGFVLIPKEFLIKAGINTSNPQEIITHPQLQAARTKMAELALKKLEVLEKSYKLVNKNDLKFVKGFVAIYQKYLEIMQKRGMEVIAPKPMISNFSKMKIILKKMLG